MLKGYKIKITTIDPVSANPLDSITLPSDSEVTSETSIIYVGSRTTAPVIVWADKTFKTLKINVIGTNHIETIKLTSKSKDAIENISVHAPESRHAANHFLIHYQTATAHWAGVYHLDKASKIAKQAFELPMADGKGAFSVTTVGSNVAFTRTTGSEISLVFSDGKAVLETWPLKLQSESSKSGLPEVVHTVTEVVAKGTSNYAVRSALVLLNGNVELVRNGESDWIRHESLAGIAAAAWADYPAKEDLARELAVESHSNPLSAYAHRVKRHIKDLGYLPAWLQAIPTRMLGSLLGSPIGSEAGYASNDAFGFRKIVVVATEKGRMMALDVGRHGRVLWNIQAVDLPAGSIWNVTDISIEDDLALVTTVGTEYLLVETLTGIIREWQAPDSVLHIARMIALSTRSGKRTLLPVTADGTPGATHEDTFGNDTFVVTKKADGSLAGWNLLNGKTTSAWTFLPKDGEVINTVAYRPAHDPVASIGRALGDRNVLYKFLSPNLAVVSAVHAASSTASLYLLDTATGETLYTTTHQAVDTSLPISIAFTENWFAYTLYTDPSLAPSLVTAENTPKAHIFTISELFESSNSNDRGPLGVGSNYSSIATPAHAPHVVSASYVIPAPLTLLATTSTKQGITPRSIIAYSAPLAALFAIPSSYLSPRKPVGRPPTTAEQEEGLFPYSPLLELNPQWAISHKREVLGIKGVLASPTLMESSSLVFAYGDLDVFGTRVAPIGTFDLLGKGFNRIQLVLTVVALAVGTSVLAPLVSRSFSIASKKTLTCCSYRFGKSKSMVYGVTRWL